MSFGAANSIFDKAKTPAQCRGFCFVERQELSLTFVHSQDGIVQLEAVRHYPWSLIS